MTAEAHSVLFQLVNVGIAQVDHHTGYFTRANEAFRAMIGYSEAELQSLTSHELTHPDDRGRDAAIFNAMKGGKLGGTSITRCLHKDGQVVWLELHGTAFQDDTGNGYNLVVINDVTERRRAEEALRESEARFRGVFSSNMVAMGIWTKTGDVIDANDQLLDLIGYTREELGAGSVSWVQLTLPEYHARDEQAVAEVVAYGACTPYEKEFIRKDGRRIPVMIGGGSFDEHTGAGIFFTVDLTDNKRAEFALRELNGTLEQRVEERTEQLKHSEQRFSQAFYSNPIPACMTTFGRETFVEVNHAFLSLTGYEHDEIVGKSSRSLAMWSSPEDLKKLTEAQHQARGFHDLELKLRTKEGAVRDILISAEVIRLDGDDGYLKMFYDITKRKETEEQMHQAIQEVMTDTSWFSRRIMERLANIKSGDTEQSEVVDLSKRERQVLERMAGGMDNTAIAAELGIAVQTVRNYISTIYDKLGVHSRVEAVLWARERGIVGS